ncbi:MAG: hypothetical protein J0M12_07340 [Deltaproteobacteria bacterium]|nr:hypothetical protein [Deltaproteobacteria bacterium]
MSLDATSTDIKSAPMGDLGIQTLPPVHPDWKPLLSTLEASPFLLGALSRQMLEGSEVVRRPSKKARIAFGVGCVHTGGVSAGVPVDWLRMPLGAVILQRTLGLDPQPLVATVGLDIAKNNPTLAPNGHWPPSDELLSIAATHLLLYKRWNDWVRSLKGPHAQAKPWLPRIQYEADSQVMKQEWFVAATEARERVRLNSVPYSSSQDALFDAYLRMLLAQDPEATMIKFGWAIPSNFEEVHNLVAVQLRLTQSGAADAASLESMPGGCESCFDLLSIQAAREIHGRQLIGYAYLKAPGGLDYRQPAACPYTAKPTPSTNGKAHTARILFKDGPESVEAAIEFARNAFGSTTKQQRTNLLNSLRSAVEMVSMFHILVPGYFDEQEPFGDLAAAEAQLRACNLRCQFALGNTASDAQLVARKKAEAEVVEILCRIIKGSWPKIIETFAPSAADIQEEVRHLRGKLPYFN